MSRETRSAFLALGILRPEKAFLQYPAAPLLFAKMQPIQKEALRAMAGKGLVSIDMLQSEIVELTPLGNETFISNSTSEYTTDEVSLMEFLTGSFAAPTDDGISALRRSAGIRRIA